MRKIVVHKHAKKYLQKLPIEQKGKIKELLLNLANSPENYPGVISMAGKWTGYRRIRIGRFRVIYWFESEEDTIYVDHIGPRGNIYKKTPH